MTCRRHAPLHGRAHSARAADPAGGPRRERVLLAGLRFSPRASRPARVWAQLFDTESRPVPPRPLQQLHGRPPPWNRQGCPRMILTYTKRPASAYALAAAALGLAALAVSLPSSARLLWDARYLLLAFCSLTLGTRVYLKVPYAGSAVPASAAFVLLAALVYGFDAAVPLAAASAAVSSLRLSRRGALLLNDAAPGAVATLLAGLGAQALGVVVPDASAYASAVAAVLFCLAHAAATSAQFT